MAVDMVYSGVDFLYFFHDGVREDERSDGVVGGCCVKGGGHCWSTGN